MKSDEERKRESEEWNNWKPGSGRKGWSPFTRPAPLFATVPQATRSKIILSVLFG